MFYYRGTELMAVRFGPWKAHFHTQGAYGADARKRVAHDPPLLFNLEHDPSEKQNVAGDHPDVIEKIRQIVARHRENLDVPPSQLEIPLN